ncbi:MULTISPECIES: hypothetical protein [unclassified Microcella]|uniref:hypothetical protein n=1 Tax=unclassified Microcella TaxID=2630066 RepID=UPI0006F21B60|nr:MULTISPECIES: hypothetical protein [unclassified Microcella]KQV25191.1 hypothetical protein ASC54_12140 [Yonghaparkia sp. Root332]KRF31473.1 hypothetical protein ASG83_11945 [Yonghaparkia sp. Soil809]
MSRWTELLASCVDPTVYCDDTVEILNSPLNAWLPLIAGVVAVLAIGAVVLRLVTRRERARRDAARAGAARATAPDV